MVARHLVNIVAWSITIVINHFAIIVFTVIINCRVENVVPRKTRGTERVSSHEWRGDRYCVFAD